MERLNIESLIHDRPRGVRVKFGISCGFTDVDTANRFRTQGADNKRKEKVSIYIITDDSRMNEASGCEEHGKLNQTSRGTRSYDGRIWG